MNECQKRCWLEWCYGDHCLLRYSYCVLVQWQVLQTLVSTLQRASLLPSWRLRNGRKQESNERIIQTMHGTPVLPHDLITTHSCIKHCFHVNTEERALLIWMLRPRFSPPVFWKEMHKRCWKKGEKRVHSLNEIQSPRKGNNCRSGGWRFMCVCLCLLGSTSKDHLLAASKDEREDFQSSLFVDLPKNATIKWVLLSL